MKITDWTREMTAIATATSNKNDNIRVYVNHAASNTQKCICVYVCMCEPLGCTSRMLLKRKWNRSWNNRDHHFLNTYLRSRPGANVAWGSHSRPSQTVADGAGRLGIEKFVDAADGFLCSSCCCFCDSDLFISPASFASHPWSSKSAWASRPLDPDTRSKVGDGVIGSGDL